jgi:outer membrane protein
MGGMKHLLSATVLCVLSLSICSLPAADETKSKATNLKVATVDLQELFKQYHKTSGEQEELKGYQDRVRKDDKDRAEQIKILTDQLDKLRKELDDPSINDAKKQAIFKDWQAQQEKAVAMDRERREFGQRRTMAINEHMVRRMKLILGEIRVIVEDYAKGAGYDIVMDKSGMSAVQIPVLLYHKDSTDITAQVLKVLNKNAPAASATKEP